MTEDGRQKTRGNRIEIVAPSRICLFGDHQDYLGLPIIACAINRQVTLTAEKNTTREFNFSLPDINSKRKFAIDKAFDTLKTGDFFASVLKRVKKYGCIPDEGYNITIQGNIPVNAGVSSSSAIVVAWTSFLLNTFGCDREITSEFIAQVAYEAEVLEHNSPGGKMDQYTIGIGNIVFIETGDYFNYQLIGKELNGLVLGESGIKKDTLGLLLSVKTNALKAIEIVQRQHPSFTIEKAILKDYWENVHFLPKELKPFFYAAIQNHLITQKALVELKKETIDIEKIGELINEHHAILRDDLKITVPRIDAMIDAALDAGAYGAKIVGSGGGGCIVAVSPKGRELEISNAIKGAGAKNAYPVLVAKGVHSL